MKNVPQLTEFQKEWIRKETAHYIFVDRDEDGSHRCFCSRCQQDVDLGKTKHKAKVICPSCGKELEILHNWRKKDPETVDWIAIPRVIDENTLMLRYVSAHRFQTVDGGRPENIEEYARLVFNPEQKTSHTFEFTMVGENTWGWRYQAREFFAEYYMMNFRKWCCLVAEPYRPTWEREMKKLKVFKYLPNTLDLVSSRLYISSNVFALGHNADFYEKLCKVGMKEFAKADLDSYSWYYRRPSFDTKETSLLKILGLNRTQLEVLKANQDIPSYELIKAVPNVTPKLLGQIKQANVNLDVVKGISELGLNFAKTLRYFDKAGVNHSEWMHYVRLLKDLGYKLDEHYLYPKDFRKEDDRVTKEYQANRDKVEDLKNAQKSEMILKISQGLRANKELMEFFSGSDGLQIFVPESAADLREEGRKLHNCLGTYIDRVANGNTLIFFIRRIEDPTAPYIAMEYCHGRVIQCRYNCNKAVEDEKIINFANALAARLVSQNILAA